MHHLALTLARRQPPTHAHANSKTDSKSEKSYIFYKKIILYHYFLNCPQLKNITCTRINQANAKRNLQTLHARECL